MPTERRGKSMITGVTTSYKGATTTDVTAKKAMLYNNLYNDVGDIIKNILNAFISGSSELTNLVNYENYSFLSDKLYSHSNGLVPDVDRFVKLLASAVEGSKQSNNRMLKHEHVYQKLLDEYNSVVACEHDPLVLEESTSLNIVAQINPDILKYYDLGYKLVDENLNYIPPKMIVLGKIRKDSVKNILP
jgi:hypothetical protein